MPGLVEDWAGQLLYLIYQKGQKHQASHVAGEVFLSVTVIVFKVVALGFQRIECLIFYLPLRATSSHDLHATSVSNPQAGDPAVGVTLFALFVVLDIFQEIELQVRMGFIQGHTIGISKPVPVLFPIGYLIAQSPVAIVALINSLEQGAMITVFGNDDEVVLVRANQFDGGTFGVQVIQIKYQPESGMVLMNVSKRPFQSVDFTVIFGGVNLMNNGLWHQW